MLQNLAADLGPVLALLLLNIHVKVSFECKIRKLMYVCYIVTNKISDNLSVLNILLYLC